MKPIWQEAKFKLKSTLYTDVIRKMKGNGNGGCIFATMLFNIYVQRTDDTAIILDNIKVTNSIQ